MSVDTISLSGKTAIVTGSGRENGLGAAIVRALARNGAAVTINCLSDRSLSRAEAFANTLRAQGQCVAVVQADVSSTVGARKLVRETLKVFETDNIGILVNNAGTGSAGPTLGESEENIDRVINNNIKGPIFMAQAAVPYIPKGGRVINISSSSSKTGESLIPVYGAAKAALDSLTWSWAAEWGRSRGIAVTSIAPGPVRTDMTAGEAGSVLLQPMVDSTRLERRYGTADEVGDAVLLLVSEQARWISGQRIGVDGGLTGP